MSSGLAWLNELMTWLGRWFPRIVLVKATHRGVKFSTGGSVTELRPGLYLYWPITTEVTLVATTHRTTEIAAQLIGREVVSIAVGFAITNPKSALVRFDDIFSQLDDRAQSHLTRACTAESKNAEICGAVLQGLVSEFGPYGVEVSTVDVIQRGRVIPLKNLNDWAKHSRAVL